MRPLISRLRRASVEGPLLQTITAAVFFVLKVLMISRERERERERRLSYRESREEREKQSENEGESLRGVKYQL